MSILTIVYLDITLDNLFIIIIIIIIIIFYFKFYLTKKSTGVCCGVSRSFKHLYAQTRQKGISAL